MSAQGDRPVGADALIEACRRQPAVRLFGLPGVHNLAVWEAAGAAGLEIVGVRHEQTAAYAADGYARVTGSAAVAVVTTGPGAANTVAATGEAMASGVPLVIVATDIPSRLRRTGVYRGVLHENRDQELMFRPVTKWSVTAASVAEIGPLTEQAFAVAATAPTGPVYLGIPTDLLSEPLPLADDRPSPPAARATVGRPAPLDLESAAALVDASRRPLIWVGGGAMRARAGTVVQRLAARIGAPIVETFSARGLIPATSPDLAPGPPHLPVIGALWDEADLVIAIGSDLDAMTTQNWRMPQPPALLAINVDPADAAKNYDATLVLAGDAGMVTEALAEVVAADPVRRVRVRVRNQRLADEVRAYLDTDEPAAGGLLVGVEGALSARSALVLDMCIPGYWLAGFARVPDATTLLYPMGWGTLGYGLPASIGAAYADVERVVCVVGDGGFLFAPGELATIRQENLPITVVIVDDGAYGMLKYDQVTHGRSPRGVDLLSPDFAQLARSFRLEVTAVSGFGSAFAAALGHLTRASGPNVLVVSASMKPPPTSSARWYRQAISVAATDQGGRT